MSRSNRRPAPSEAAPHSQLPPWVPQQKRWAYWLERLSLWIERPINRLSGTAQLNPFYHTGTIAIFLLAVVAFTGFYLYIFFHYGFDRSYEAVAIVEGQPIGRLMRALHRYASGALIITTFFHAIRLLFMERFRGPRWLAWVTGHVMLALMWGAGVTGYWMVWDGRAQILTDRFVAFLDRFTPYGARFSLWLVQLERGRDSWIFIFLLLVAHIVLFLITAAFFYLHVLRLKRPKWIPELPSIIGMGVVLLVGSLLFPAGMLGAADPFQTPIGVTYDPIFLFFFPAAGTWGWATWGVLLTAGVWLTILPWTSRPRQSLQPVQVLDDQCTGCTRCALDCPYDAITMLALPETTTHKYLAEVDPAKCVACGICLGSCTDDALLLNQVDAPALSDLVQQRLTAARSRAAASGREDDIEIVLTCARFANHGAAPYLARRVDQVEATHELVEVIPVPCAGAVPPDLLVDTLEAGAAEVRLVGCPPDDCLNREGNLWAEQRLTRERPPRLRRQYAEVPISAVWLPPNQFDDALQADVHAAETGWLETRRLMQSLTWKNFLPAFALLGVILLGQILTNDLPYRSPFANSATVEIVLPDPAKPFGWLALNGGAFQGGNVDLAIEVDGVARPVATLPSSALFQNTPQPFYKRLTLAPGQYDIALTMTDQANGRHLLITHGVYELQAGEIIRLVDETGRAERPAGTNWAK